MDIHERAKEISIRYQTCKVEFIEILIELDQSKAYKEKRYDYLNAYAIGELNLSPYDAGYFINVARKSVEFPALREALQKQRVTVSNAAKLVSKLTQENAQSVVDHLAVNSAKKTLRWLCGEQEEKLHLQLALRIVDILKRVQTISQKSGDLEQTIEDLGLYYIKKEDPLEVAARALKRKAKKEKLTEEKSNAPKPRQYSADTIHSVNNRDQRQCCFRGDKRCKNRMYLALHHIIEVANGGPDTPENLLTLCTFHHKMVHEEKIPREIQRSWQGRVEHAIEI